MHTTTKNKHLILPEKIQRKTDLEQTNCILKTMTNPTFAKKVDVAKLHEEVIYPSIPAESKRLCPSSSPLGGHSHVQMEKKRLRVTWERRADFWGGEQAPLWVSSRDEAAASPLVI